MTTIVKSILFAVLLSGLILPAYAQREHRHHRGDGRGYHHWDGRGYHYRHYHRCRQHRQWVSGHWEYYHRGREWIPGHWVWVRWCGGRGW